MIPIPIGRYSIKTITALPVNKSTVLQILQNRF